jgi:hypothetical protein
MMDAEKREKVIRRLEKLREYADSEVHPIVSPDNWGIYSELRDLIDEAEEDALALLKAQEPRVMAYEELSTFDGAFIIESSAVHPLEWVFFFDTDAKSDAVWVQGFDGERYIVYREDYGIYVRCWTYRPDQATREATSWDAQEQRDYEAAVEMAEYCERYEPTYNADDGSM